MGSRLRQYWVPILIGTFLVPSVLRAQPAAFVLERDTDVVTLDSGLRGFEDTSGTLKLDDVKARIADFRELPAGVPSFGYTDSAFWFLLEFDNRDRQDRWVLEVGYPPLDDVAVYVQSTGSFSREYVGGDKRHFDVRYRPYRNINFGLELPARQKTEVWIRVKTESSVQMPLILHSERHFGDRATADMTGQGLLFGTFLVMIFFNALVWLRSRDANYLVLVGFLVGLGGLQAGVSGLLFQFIFPKSPWLVNAGLTSSGLCAGGFALLYAKIYLPLSRPGGRLEPVVSGLMKLSFGAALVSIFIPYKFAVSMCISILLIGTAVAMYAGIDSVVRGSKAARLYLIGWGTFFVTAVIFILKTVGLLPSTGYTEAALPAGTVFLVTSLAVGLGERFRDIEEVSVRRVAETRAVKTELAEELEARLMIFSGVAHRLNNPLNYIQLGADEVGHFTGKIFAFIDQLFFGFDDNPEAKQMRAHVDELIDGCERSFERMQVGVFRAAKVVDEMRGISGVDGDAWAECSIDDVLDEARKQVEADLGLTYCDAVGFENQLDDMGRAQIVGNPYLMVQALGQVLENAYLFSPEGESISVRLGTRGRGQDHLSIEVRSCSGALEADVEAKIFNMGFSTVGRRGTGLNVARKMLRQDGGDLLLIDAGRESGAVIFSLLLKKAARTKQLS